MHDRPLLVFPVGEDKAERAGRTGGPPGDVALPTRQQQGQRIGNKFLELARQLRRRQLRFYDDPAAAHPSEIVVFELFGSAPDFYNAVRRINGLAWLMDSDIGDAAPDELFHDPRDKDARLRRRVLAVSMNRSALTDLIKLFRMYRRGEKLPHNFGAFEALFAHVRDVRPWQFTDRVEGTGLEEYLQQQLLLGSQTLTCSIEVFCTGDVGLDTASVARVVGAIQPNGQVVASALVPAIRHLELRARLPIGNARTVAELEQIEVFRLEDVMFVRPRAQALVEFDEIDENVELPVRAQAAPKLTQPRLAMLDGVPIQNHPLLAGYVVLDDPDAFEVRAPVLNRIHGTGMLSLAIHGDLAANQQPLDEKIYLRPILVPRQALHTTIEEVPEDFLPIDLIHRSVVRLFEGERAAPDIRVICLCVGDRLRPLDWYASPWAKLLDYLSWKYSVLFLVSAGNHVSDFELNIPSAEFAIRPPALLDGAMLAEFLNTLGSRPLLSPAEAINVITVGAAGNDAAAIPAHSFVPYTTVEHRLPAPYTASGGGIGRMVKPEIFMPGGRQAFRLDPLSPPHSSRLKPLSARGSPGHEVASPPRSQAFLKGTSNSAALALRACSQIMDAIAPAIAAAGIERSEEVALIKALLVHSASWGGAREIVGEILSTNVAPQALRNEVARVLGYGFAHPDRVTQCTPARITVIAAGKILEERSIIFRFPLPPSLAARVATRTITTTLAFLSPISVTSRTYRSHNVWLSHSFRAESLEDSLQMRTGEAHEPLVSRGTTQHLVFTGEAAMAFVDGDFLELKVNCKRDSGERVTAGLPFGLAATLDVHTQLGVDLYAEVRNRIQVAAPVQVRVV